MAEHPVIDSKYAVWKGVPREEIHWNLTVELEACVGCGMCITSCGSGVYDPESKQGSRREIQWLVLITERLH